MKKTAFCFDFDGTLTRRELLPLIAAEVGLYEEIMALTQATIQGVLPFESSFKLRCKLLADVPVSRVQDIAARVPLFEGIAAFIRSRPEDCFIVTGNLDVWIEKAARKVCPNVFASRALIEQDRLIAPESVLDKSTAVAKIRESHDEIIAIGDGLGDVAMMEAADLAIAFGGLHSPVETLVQISDVVCPSEESLLNVLEHY